MDNELAYLRSMLASADWLLDLAVDTYWTRSGLPWEDRLEKMLAGLRANGLEAYEHPSHARTVVAWPCGTRRKNPAFIAIHAGQYPRFNAVWRFSGASFTIEVVEAGRYGVAGHGPITDLRAEA